MRCDKREERFRQGGTDVSVFSCALEHDGPAEEAFAGFRVCAGHFAPEGAMTLIFRSEWGREMTPVWQKAAGTDMAVTAGRSSHGWSPFLFIREAAGTWIWVALQWPGNWRMTLTAEGEILFGMDGAMLSGTLKPGETLPLPRVLTARNGDFNALRQDVCRFLRAWLPPTRMDPAIVSWNPWWRYEDCDISEDIVLANARVAKELGIDLIVLDAGWFGGVTPESHWTRRRGDWDQEDRQRFPHGIGWLAEQIHALGLRFGLWMEPEGMGVDSRLRREHPEWEALRDGRPLPEPYLCLGAEGAAEWLCGHMARLVRLTKADWIKLDFNVDPGLGCSRGDHGHQAGMGLYAHVQAYLRLLDDLRAEFPHLVVENCSSGGLRLDLAMMAHTDVCFLSDPDETAHSLQCFLWLAFLPPERLLHWAWSETRRYPDGSHVFPGLPAERLPDALPGAMLHPFGFSRDLTALTEAQRQDIAGAIARFRRDIAPLIARGTVRLLTPPPLRTGERAGDDGRCFPESTGPWVCQIEADGRAARLTLHGDGRAEMELLNDIKEESTC
ncbi:MAG: glycoside hydrolase family 36 protein [Aristaeellaceae bacterium]